MHGSPCVSLHPLLKTNFWPSGRTVSFSGFSSTLCWLLLREMSAHSSHQAALLLGVPEGPALPQPICASASSHDQKFQGRHWKKHGDGWGQLLLLPQRYCAFFGEPSLWPKNMHKNSACAYAHTVLAPVFVADSPKVEGMKDPCIIHLNNKYKAKTYKKCMNFCESLKSLNFAFWYVGLSGCVFLKLFLIPKVRNFVKETEHKEIRLSTSPSSR